jgi:2-oxo-3-hexenedioate decarboxylase
VQDPIAIATQVVDALANHRPIPPFGRSLDDAAIADAYRVTALLRAAFEARGEKITGRKIGFTNREMWTAHGVAAPIWGYCTDRTTHALADRPLQYTRDFVEPRIEPEIVFGLAEQPAPDMDASALLACVDWVALGYEVVQSIFPNWKFTTFDTIAANALHGALLIGERHAITPRKSAWMHELATFEVDLYCNGTLRQRGGGTLVLGSPVSALHHLVGVLADDPFNPPLDAGEVVSTGTLTLAMPVRSGQTWRAQVRGIPLNGIDIQFAA